MRHLLWILVITFVISCSNTYYIVRHAEKEVPAKGSSMVTTGDPHLSEIGKQRATELKKELKGKHIRYIFSTNTQRTLETVEPLKQLMQLKVNLYDQKDSLDKFISRLKNIRRGNVLVIGHSNTVDDIVNKLCGQTKIPGDLKENEYDNLFIVKRIGNKFRFRIRKY